MKIAIDINEVLRDYAHTFARLYHDNVNRDSTAHLSRNEGEFYTSDLRVVFPFNTDTDYFKFTYEDYVWELYAECKTSESIYKNIATTFNKWLLQVIPNIDTDEQVEVIIVSPFECGLSIPATYFFLSKLGAKVREVYFPTDSATIWDKCDILVTANPTLLEMKPENKVTVKIDFDYNRETEADYTYKDGASFFSDENNIEKIINEYGRK